MAHCHDMKEGMVLTCGDCGFELKVVKECKECGADVKECGCSECTFVCCDKPMKLM